MKIPLFLILSSVALADPSIAWWSVEGGGGTSRGGVFELNGSMGQPDAGPVMQGGVFQITGGFWVALQIPNGPLLSLTIIGDEVILTWPLTATGWTLESSATLAPEPWVPVSQPVQDTATDHTVTLPLTDAPKMFFRLRN